jgi:predicted N-acetyltransferase YhbS
MAENETTHARVQQEVIFREVSRHDVEAIAALHAESWRRHYRGAYLDSFLDGDVLADRLAVWDARLTALSADYFTIVADQCNAVVGFVHMILDEDPDFGMLLDNLHVTHQLKRHGIGRRLLAKAARELVQRRPADKRFYFWVLAQIQRLKRSTRHVAAPRSKPHSADRFPVGESAQPSYGLVGCRGARAHANVAVGRK